MDGIGCGVIGLGWFDEHHVETLRELPQANLVTACTRRPSRAKEVAEKYGIPKTYTDYHEMLENKDVEMVSIVTPVKDHLRPTIDALKAGKHVFLEKPMADSPEECDAIIEEIKKTDKCFMVG